MEHGNGAVLLSVSLSLSLSLFLFWAQLCASRALRWIARGSRALFEASTRLAEFIHAIPPCQSLRSFGSIALSLNPDRREAVAVCLCLLAKRELVFLGDAMRVMRL
jgi:hypothetical protein